MNKLFLLGVVVAGYALFGSTGTAQADHRSCDDGYSIGVYSSPVYDTVPSYRYYRRPYYNYDSYPSYGLYFGSYGYRGHHFGGHHYGGHHGSHYFGGHHGGGHHGGGHHGGGHHGGGHHGGGHHGGGHHGGHH